MISKRGLMKVTDESNVVKRGGALGGPVLIAAIVVAACGGGGSPIARASGSLLGSPQCAANRAVGTMTYVSPVGFDASAGIIDVFAAQRLGYFKDMCLGVNVVTSSQMSTELVASGKAAVSSIGSAADDLGEVAGGADVVAVATYGDTSDYAILTGPSITNLKQLEGKTFGYHSTLPVAILEMFHAAGVDVSKVQQVDTQNYDPNQLIRGQESAIQAYQSNEPLVLSAEKAQFNEFTPSQFGVKGTFNVQIFNGEFVARHKQAVTDFMRAELHAFYYCAAHQASCIGIEQRYARAAGSEYQVSHERAVWNLEAALALGHTLPGKGVGVQTIAEWQPEAAALEQYGIAKSVGPLGKWEDTSIVASLYDGKTLIWP
jgi:NitT/TauT family transport system substrate-binding protein